MTENLSPKLLHDLEAHYHNIEVLYNDGIDRESIRATLNIPYKDWMPMDDIIFNNNAILKCNNIFDETIFYKYNNFTGKLQEIKDES